MNVLLVDDQRAIVESVKSGVRWDMLPVERLYTAGSVLEAKLIFMNFSVDLLITDIEMPGENGIDLAGWVRDKFDDVEIVFLTSHSDFDYAKQAIRFRIFDYILQPVRYTDIEAVVMKVQGELGKKRQIHTLREQANLAKKQRNAFFDSMMMKCLSGREKDTEDMWEGILHTYAVNGEAPSVYVALISVWHWLKLEKQWSDSLVSLFFSNVLEELFVDFSCTVTVANVNLGKFWVFFLTSEEIPQERLYEGNRRFCEFMERYADFRLSVYMDTFPVKKNEIARIAEDLQEMDSGNANRRCGIFYRNEMRKNRDEREDLVESVMAYVHENVWKKGCSNVGRADAAAHVHMNQEYMSRVFKERTGISFKDFVLQEKMKFAEKLLRETGMSVSVIASKTGFTNFSHFSSMFKRFYGETPADYRKTHS